MPRDRIYSSIFLMLVLVLGFVSYPASFPSIGLVFADDDCDDLKGKDKADCIKKEKDEDDKGKSKDKNEKAVKTSDDDDDEDDKGKSKDKNEKAAKTSDDDDDDEKEDEIEIEVEVKKGKAKVEIKIDDEEIEFEIDTTDEDEIINEISKKTGLGKDKISSLTKFEVEEEDEDENENEEGKITICHFPPGNPLNAHTISVGSPNAASKHMTLHGDELGPCEIEGPGRGDISVHGIKYFDANQNGEKDPGEQVLDNWTIVLLLSSETRDTQSTNTQGEYWFDGLEEGTYEIKEVLQPGWTQIEPFGGSYQVILSSDSKMRQGFDFGNFLESFDSNELFQELLPNRASSIESADDIISQLMQKIEELEKRLQTLLLKLESGNYYGNTNDADTVIRSFGMSFDGSSTSKTDSTQSDVSGEVFLESLVTRDNSSKFRVIGGTISIGDMTHDIIFGKARASSSGPSGEKDSMVLIAQLIDEKGNDHTIKLILDFEKSLEGNFGIEPMNFEIKPQSAVSNDWSLSATGQLTVL